MKNLMKAKIRMTMETWPMKKAVRAFMLGNRSRFQLFQLYWRHHIFCGGSCGLMEILRCCRLASQMKSGVSDLFSTSTESTFTVARRLLPFNPIFHVLIFIMPDLSGEGASSSKSQSFNVKLPATCDPPSDMNPPKEAVWIVGC
jgi:hypothetical protein